MLSRLRLFVTLWIVAHQAPLPMEFSRQEYWSGLPFPSPGDLPHLGIKPCSPAFQADSLPSESPGKPSSVQFSYSVVSDSATPWTIACQASLSINNSQSLLKLMSIESVTPSNHLILCCPLLLLPSIFPSIRIFPKESSWKKNRERKGGKRKKRTTRGDQASVSKAHNFIFKRNFYIIPWLVHRGKWKMQSHTESAQTLHLFCLYQNQDFFCIPFS